MPSQKFRDEFYRRQTGEIVLDLLTIHHDDFPAPTFRRFVNNHEDVTSRGNVFTAAYFEVVGPDERPDRPPQVALRLDNVDRVILALLDGLDQTPPFSPPTLILERVLASDLPGGAPETATPELQARIFDYDLATIEATFEGPPLFTKQYPAHSQTPGRLPGLFKR